MQPSESDTPGAFLSWRPIWEAGGTAQMPEQVAENDLVLAFSLGARQENLGGGG